MSKKSKWTKKGPRRWEMGDYAVEATNDGASVVFRATVRVSDGVETIGAARADGTKGSLTAARKRAQACCEEHLAGAETEPEPTPADSPARPERFVLDWQEGESDGTWVARGPDGDEYLIDESTMETGGVEETSYWPKHADPVSRGGEEEELWQEPGGCSTREEAEAVCQWHVDTRLQWRENDSGTWLATSVALGCVAAWGYACRQGDDGLWQAHDADEEPLGGRWENLAVAQDICQENHREQYPPPTPAKALDEKPRRELDDWVIGRPPSVELRAELAVKQAKTSEEIEELENELAFEERQFRATKKRIEKEIAEIRGRQKSLAVEVRHGMSAKVRCWRERVNGEWLYTDESGAELYREPAATGPQQKLVGDRTVPLDPPPDKPPAAKTTPPPAEPEPEANPRLLLPIDRDISKKSEWDPIKDEAKDGEKPRPARLAYICGDQDGEHYRATKSDPGLWCVTFVAAGGHERDVPGTHTRLKDAFPEAHADNKTRLRWPPLEPGQQIIACGPYQLARASGHPDDDPERDDWQIAYVAPGIDAKAGDLGTHTGLTAAQDACHAHAAELRATEAAA